MAKLQDGRVVHAGAGRTVADGPDGRSLRLYGNDPISVAERAARSSLAFPGPLHPDPRHAGLLQIIHGNPPTIMEPRIQAFGPQIFVDPATNAAVNPAILERFKGKRLPVSVRNNNMGALSTKTKDIGSSFPTRQRGFVGVTKRPPAEGGYYAKYATAEHGVAGPSLLLESYGREGTDTPREIVTTWSTDKKAHATYANTLVKHLRAAGFLVNADTPLDLSNKDVRVAILKAMSAHESGTGMPVYDDAVFERGASYRFSGPVEGAEPLDRASPEGVVLPKTAPVPTQRFQVTPATAPIPTSRRFGGQPGIAPGYLERDYAEGGDLTLPAADNAAAGGIDTVQDAAPTLAETQGATVARAERDIVPGLGLGNLAPRDSVFGPPGGVEFNLGTKRPYMPNQSIVDIVRNAVDYVYGPDYKVEVFSGRGNSGAKNRHPSGNAVDIRVYAPDGRLLTVERDREGLLAVGQAAMARGARGVGLGTGYMDGVGMHIDTVDPIPGKQDYVWGDVAKANRDVLDAARTRGVMPLPMRMAPPPWRPLPPEGGMHRAALAGLEPGQGNPFPLEGGMHRAGLGGISPQVDVGRRSALPPEGGMHRAGLAGITPSIDSSQLKLPPEGGWHRAALSGMNPPSALERRGALPPEGGMHRAALAGMRQPVAPQGSSALPPEGSWHRAALSGMNPSPDLERRSALPPEGGMHRAALAGMSAGRLGLRQGEAGRLAGVEPRRVSTVAFPPAGPAPSGLLPYTGTARMPAPRGSGALGALERLAANPISLGQPGGKYAGSGLNAMMGVRSGMAPVGTVARSASNPDVTAVSLPHGNVAHVNSKYGYISTWSPVDDDERGTVFGKALAIDPTGKHYGYYSPGRAQALASKGWSVFGPGPAAGKSIPGPAAARSGLPGLAGFLSGLFGPSSKSPIAMAAANAAASRQASAQQGLAGFLTGLFGPGTAGGGISGTAGGLGGTGPAGGGMGGLGDNYSGL